MTRLLRTVCGMILYCAIAVWPLEIHAQIPPSSKEHDNWVEVSSGSHREAASFVRGNGNGIWQRTAGTMRLSPPNAAALNFAQAPSR